MSGGKQRTSPQTAVSAAVLRAAANIPTTAGTQTAERIDALPQASAPKKGDTVLEVPIASCDPYKYNARTFYAEQSLREFALTLSREGQLDPVNAIADPADPSRWKIVNGVRRLRALTLGGATTIKISVLPDSLSDIELYRLSNSLNESAERQTDLDNAFAWRRLINDGLVENQPALAAIVGKSEATVSRMLSLTEMHEELLAVMREAPARFGWRLASELAQFSAKKGVSAAVALANKALTDDSITVRYVAAAKERTTPERQGEPRRENPTTTRPFSLSKSGPKVGALKLFASGRVSLELRQVSPEMQQRIKNAIEAAMEQVEPAE